MQKHTDNPSSLGELRSQMCERLDEQWLMLQQLTRCMQETSRQLATLTTMLDYRSSQHERQLTTNRPLRFNPQVQATDEAGSSTSVCSEATIALRAPLHIKERYSPPVRSKPKRRTAPLSICKMIRAAAEQTQKQPHHLLQPQQLLIQTTTATATATARPPPPPPEPEPKPTLASALAPALAPAPAEPPQMPAALDKKKARDSSKSVLELTRMFEHRAHASSPSARIVSSP